ncbi:MAG: prepilin-type N-terminal cleavage/methylation domain-containing protein [Patescibacteria group bacterium]
MSKYRNIEILKNQKGFTLVETIVTTFVFSVMSIIVATNFVDILGLQRRSFDAQLIQEESLFAIESMAREIRVSQVQGSDSTNCSLTTLTITHPVNGSITYSVNNGIINKTTGGNTFPITSSKANFSRLNFCVNGTGVNDTQPRATIIASVKTANSQNGLQFDIQTTISSRDTSEELLN